MNTHSNLSSRSSRALGATAALCCGIFAAVSTAALAADAYIESDGTQFINTGYHVNPSSKVELDFAFVDFDNTSAYVPTRLMDNNPTASFPNLACTIYVAGTAGTETNSLAISTGDRNVEGSEKATNVLAGNWTEKSGYPNPDGRQKYCDSTVRTVSIDETTRYMRIFENGEQVWYLSNGGTYNATYTAKRPLILLGRPTNDAGSAADSRSTARIYGFRIYEGGELLHDYVPALKGGEAGLYDTIGGGFLRNIRAEGNPLAHGGDIREIPDDGYVSTFGNDGSVKIDNVDYPVARNLYFDTKYTPNDTTRVELDYSFADDFTSNEWWIMGSHGNGYFGYFLNSSSAGWSAGQRWLAFSPNLSKTSGIYAKDVRRTVTIDMKNLLAPASVATAGITNAVSKDAGSALPAAQASSLKIGARGNAQAFSPIKIYGLKIYENNSILRSYKPYVRDGIPGLLDTIGQGGFLPAAVATNALNVGYGGLIDSDAASKEACVETTASAKQSIDTGYSVGPNTRIEFSFALTGTKEDGGLTEDWYLLDNQISSPAYKVNFLYQYSSGKFVWSCGSTTWQRLSSPLPAAGVRHTVVMDCHAKTLSVASANGTSGTISIANPPAAVMTGNTLRLGSRYNGTSCWAGIRIFFCRISEYDATTGKYDLKHEFVPYTDGTQVGLYDAVEGGVKGDVRNSAVPLTITGMGVDGAEMWLKELPATATVPTEGSITLTAAAAGAKSYKWTKNGEVVAGATGETCAAAWRKGDYNTPDIYVCTAIYDVFGVETEGEPVSCNVFSTPSAFVMVVR